MKPLKHEYILWALLALFIPTYILLSLFSGRTTTLEPPETESVAFIVNLNTASAEELEMLDGIGRKTALEIIRVREKHGPFEYSSQLCRVPGIGLSVLDKIKDYSKV